MSIGNFEIEQQVLIPLLLLLFTIFFIFYNNSVNSLFSKMEHFQGLFLFYSFTGSVLIFNCAKWLTDKIHRCRSNMFASDTNRFVVCDFVFLFKEIHVIIYAVSKCYGQKKDNNNLRAIFCSALFFFSFGDRWLWSTSRVTSYENKVSIYNGRMFRSY